MSVPNFNIFLIAPPTNKIGDTESALVRALREEKEDQFRMEMLKKLEEISQKSPGAVQPGGF